MFPPKGLEYNEGLPLPTHKGNQSTKGVYKQGCAKLGTNQTHPSPWAFFEKTCNKAC